MISLFLQPMEPYLDRQEVLGQKEKEGTLAPEEIRVRSKQNRGNTAYISGRCSSWTGRSLRHFMFTGDTGRPGLPGLPGSYAVQVPHRVQKREAGVCLLHEAEPHKKKRPLQCARNWALLPVFSIHFQAIKWSAATRGIAVKLTGAKGLKYYWVMPHFIFIHLSFIFSGSAVSKAK